MRENDYDHLFRQLCNLKIEAPCHNGTCDDEECEQCGYCIDVDDGYFYVCSIDAVRREAEYRYNKQLK